MWIKMVIHFLGFIIYVNQFYFLRLVLVVRLRIVQQARFLVTILKYNLIVYFSLSNAN